MGLSSVFGDKNEISKYEGVINLGTASGNDVGEISVFVMPPHAKDGEIIEIDLSDFEKWQNGANVIPLEHLSKPLQEITQASIARQGAETVLENYDMHTGSRPSFLKDDGVGLVVGDITAEDLPEVIEALKGITIGLHNAGGPRVDDHGHKIPADSEHIAAAVRINEVDPVLEKALFASRIEVYRDSLKSELPDSEFSPKEQAGIIDTLYKVTADDPSPALQGLER
ncbi:MAG: hypothetical protein KDI11_00960 [Alphaproteobacteria bacterium]|nr:hypothetical protein [Alphaproteobacteria bacterium]